MKKHLLLLIMLCLTGVGSAWAQTEINTAVALKQLFTNGGEGKLTADITINENLAISLTSKPITLDFNGCTINGGTSSRITVSDGVTLTFTDNIGGGGFASGNMMPIYINGGNITINSGIFSTSYNTAASSLIHIPNTAVNPVVTINGGSFIAGYRVIRANVGTVNIYGGRFSGRINHTPSSGGSVNMYGGMKENLTESSNASSFNSIYYNKIINGWKVYSVIELGDGDIDNNQLKGGTFTFNPSLPLYNIGESLVADGRVATPQGTTPETWVVGEAVSKTYTIHFVNETGFGETPADIETEAIPDLSGYAYSDEEFHIEWYTDEGCTTPVPVEGTALSSILPQGEYTLTLYAKKVGQLKEYTIHFVNTTGYGNTPDNIAGQTTIPDNLPDYAADDSHIVWYTDEACTTPAVAGTRIREIVGLEVDVITLHAKWEEMATSIDSEEKLRNLFTNGGKGILTAPITLTGNLNVTSTVELDFNGYSITAGNNSITVGNTGTLTLTDNKNGEGGITATGARPLIVEGNTIINGGTFMTSNTSASYAACVTITSDATNAVVTINGGHFSSSTGKKTTNATAGTMNIYGGRFDTAIGSSSNSVNVYGCITSLYGNYTTKGNNKVINSMHVYWSTKDNAANVFNANDKLIGGTFTFDPTDTFYGLTLAEGYSVTAYEATAEEPYHKTWVVTKDVIIDKDGNEIDPASWDGSNNNFGYYDGGNTEIQDKVNVFHKTGENTYVCNNLTLTDGQNFALPAALAEKTLTANVTYTRTASISTEKFATVCLPYSFPMEGLKVMQFESYDSETGTLKFTRVDETVPGTPYLVCVDNGGEDKPTLNLSTTNVTISTDNVATRTGANLYGTYQSTTIRGTEGEYSYFGYSASTGTFKKASNSGNNCGAFRCYFKVLTSQVPTGENGRTMNIRFDDDNMTGIDNMIVEVGENAEPIYNLSGVRVSNPTKAGIYIQGKRKIVIK